MGNHNKKLGKIRNVENNVNGVQIGLANASTGGRHIQLGIYNQIKINNEKMKRGFLMNYNFKGEGRR